MNVPSSGQPPVPDSAVYREVRELLRTFRESGWSGMTVRVHGMRITAGKAGPPAVVVPAAVPAPTPVPAAMSAPAPVSAPAPAAASSPERTASPPPATGDVDVTGCVAVTSPAVGAFWVAPSPGQPPYVQVGDVVAQDQQLAIVEVMKLMNPVVASVAGRVVQVCAANADLVEYEQTLFWIRPADG